MNFCGDDEEDVEEEKKDYGILDDFNREFKYVTRLNPKEKDDDEDDEEDDDN